MLEILEHCSGFILLQQMSLCSDNQTKQLRTRRERGWFAKVLSHKASNTLLRNAQKGSFKGSIWLVEVGPSNKALEMQYTKRNLNCQFVDKENYFSTKVWQIMKFYESAPLRQTKTRVFEHHVYFMYFFPRPFVIVGTLNLPEAALGASK